MRELVLDTETTGFDPESGDRIVEIGAVELWNHMPTGETYHVYINPERDMPEGAFGVHGIGPDIMIPPRKPEPGQVTLLDKPLFKDVAQGFLDFVRDDVMVIHNANFDMKFLNAELRWLGLKELPMSQSLDTLAMARKKFPGSPATLDALCRRYAIDNSNRTLHGALLDSEILAEVYLELIGGKQPDFGLSTGPSKKSGAGGQDENWRPSARPNPLPSRLSEDEKKAHADFVDGMGDDAVWKRFS
ncbi:DNA polymerase III subunit epsilon [Thalassobius sp. I31.1]|uniref:DNA polymerase III subunit epsilon n=1 Tax=Thalassobius sp. I31.1 TaxID=2109912 RepID=UPI000D1C1E27|nr:DNA polymerase III subunit epsilon [Thalassobius sp. I31.1]